MAVTAYPEVRHNPDFKAAGFDDFLVKPVDLSMVRLAVEKWIVKASTDRRGGTARA